MPANPCNQDTTGAPERPLEPVFSATYPNGPTVPLNITDYAGTGPPHPVPSQTPKHPPVDCFYVYPTVDLLPNPLLQVGSDPPSPDDSELAVVLAQAARFESVCRLFVPAYRQESLLGLVVGPALGGGTSYGLGQSDVLQAWRYYWSHYNLDPTTGRRRGVILLGDSQGSSDLIHLIQSQIDGNPAEPRQLVSAILLGGNVTVPSGQLDGVGSSRRATFQNIPLCRRASRAVPIPIGCVVAYSSFETAGASLPPGDALFGLTDSQADQVACVNPAALLDGPGPNLNSPDARVPITPSLPTQRLLDGSIIDPGACWASYSARCRCLRPAQASRTTRAQSTPSAS
jgi:hypothetical protein